MMQITIPICTGTGSGNPQSEPLFMTQFSPSVQNYGGPGSQGVQPLANHPPPGNMERSFPEESSEAAFFLIAFHHLLNNLNILHAILKHQNTSWFAANI